jgi:hypothetical protein
MFQMKSKRYKIARGLKKHFIKLCHPLKLPADEAPRRGPALVVATFPELNDRESPSSSAYDFIKQIPTNFDRRSGTSATSGVDIRHQPGRDPSNACARKESRGLEEIKVSEGPELPTHRGMVQ